MWFDRWIDSGRSSASVDGSIGAIPTAADIAVRDGEEWVAFQSLADQFDPAADQDGIDGDDTIFMVRPDGTGLHRLPPEDLVGSEIRPTWSADGSQIAFLRGHLPDDLTELWTINADGSDAQLRFICKAPCNTIDYPDWGASGRFIYFQRDTVPEVEGPPSVFEIYRLELSTGEATSVLRREDGMSVEFAGSRLTKRRRYMSAPGICCRTTPIRRSLSARLMEAGRSGSLRTGRCMLRIPTGQATT